MKKKTTNNIFEPKAKVQSKSESQTSSILENMVNSLLEQGIDLHRAGELLKAKSLYEKTLKLDPKNFNSIQLLGVISTQTKNWTVALDYYKQALEIDFRNPVVFCNQGIVLQELNRFDEAIFCYDKAIEFKWDYAEAYYSRGVLLKKLMRLDEALRSYDKAIEIECSFADAYFNRGILLFELSRLDESLQSYNRAIEFKSESADIFYNRGIVLAELKRFEEALSSYDRSIVIKNNSPDTYYNRALVLYELMRMDESLKSYDLAIMHRTDFAEAYSNRGNVLKELNRFDEALWSYDRAIELKCDYADAYYNRGVLLDLLKEHEKALFCYEKTEKIEPNYHFLLGLILTAKLMICDWRSINGDREILIDRINAKKRASPSFQLISLEESPLIQQKTAKIWAESKHPTNHSLGPIYKRRRGDKVRIAYYSPDFRDHPVAQWVAELFELHDRSKFEIFAFYFGPKTNDDYQIRIASAFDEFIDVSDKTDIEVARLSRKMGVDIGIDLAGFTNLSRTGIFACRAAPIQVNYIGFPSTMGTDYIDYIIADEVLIPKKNQQYYTEKIIYLPFTYKPTDTKIKISQKAYTKDEFDLPDNNFVFCCFNNNYKISPRVYDSWMRILKSVENSVLWIPDVNPVAKNNLRKEAEARGVDADRLIFAKRMDDLSDHLQRLKLADLFLDTFTFNAHTTAGDALWAGLPLLTCIGQSFASRVAASFLSAIGLSELITITSLEYEAMAIELATSTTKLQAIKDKLARNRLTTPLFNMPQFTKYLESAYIEMIQRYEADLSAQNIYIKP